jgi:hypothetical protein
MPVGRDELIPSPPSSLPKLLDFNLTQALLTKDPAKISEAYKAMADFHFSQRNMATADELYAFSALHFRGIGSNSSTAEISDGGTDHQENTARSQTAPSLSTPRLLDWQDVHGSSILMSPRGGNPCTNLFVTVLEAQSLDSLPAITSASQSLFCTVSLECPGKTSITARTELIPYSDTPKWNARFEFRIDDLAVHQGFVSVAIMSRRIFSPSTYPSPRDRNNNLEMAVSRIGVVRSIRLHQIHSGNGTLQRWFTVSPAPEQEMSSSMSGVSSGNKCRLAVVLKTSEGKMPTSSTSSPAILSPNRLRSPSATPLTSPRSVLSQRSMLTPRMALATPRKRDASDAPCDASSSSSVARAHSPARASGAALPEGDWPRRRAPDDGEGEDMGTRVVTRSLVAEMTQVNESLQRKPVGKVTFAPPAVIVLSLNRDLDAVAASQEARRRFQEDLADDVASALRLTRRQILCFALRRPEVQATLGILLPARGPSAALLVAELLQQMEVRGVGGVLNLRVRSHTCRITRGDKRCPNSARTHATRPHLCTRRDLCTRCF